MNAWLAFTLGLITASPVCILLFSMCLVGDRAEREMAAWRRGYEIGLWEGERQ